MTKQEVVGRNLHQLAIQVRMTDPEAKLSEVQDWATSHGYDLELPYAPPNNRNGKH